MHSCHSYCMAVGHAGEKKAPILPLDQTCQSFCSQTACGAEPTDGSTASATLGEVVIKAVDLPQLIHHDKYPTSWPD